MMAESKPEYFSSPPAFARVGLLFYTLLIVYASWYPFSGWYSLGLSPFAWLFAPLPYYWTKFDLLTNIVGYAPFGTLMVFALYPKMRGAAAFLLAFLSGMLLSTVMESVQTFLPSRVASNLDLLANTVGVFIGAGTGLLLRRAFLEKSRLLVLRHRWFTRDAGHALIVVALWPFAQIYPQGYLFGHGQLTPILSDWISEWLEIPVDIGAMFRHSKQLTVEQYWLSEAIITSCALTGALLMLLCLLRIRAPKTALAMLLLAAAIIIKSMASALQFSPENAFAWLTPGAEGGMLLGIVMLSGLIFAPPAGQRRVAALTLLMSLIVINAVPANPYFTATLQTWIQGKFLNFNGAAQFLSLAWPFFALWVLLRPAPREKREK